MGVYAGPDVSESGLVLALDAGNTKSYPGIGTTWTDLSGRGNTGTFPTAPTYSSSNGGSIVFDGVNDYVIYNNNSTLQLTNDLTICFWVKVNSGDQTGRGVIVKGPTGNDYDYMVYLTSNSVNWSLYKKNSSGTGENRGGFTGTYVDKWTYISFTKNNTTCGGYENGILRQSDDFTTSEIRTSTNNFRIGFGWSNYFNGNISSVKIYNRALTASEIQQNFNATKSRYGL